MPNLKEVRNKIASVNSTKQITSAMKMVSASKLKKAQNAILQMRPYANKLFDINYILFNFYKSINVVYTEERPLNNILIISISSNRGLCGPFNVNINRRINQEIEEQFKEKNVTILPIGKKTFDFFKKTSNLIKDKELIEECIRIMDKCDYQDVYNLCDKIIDFFMKNEFDHIYICYNKFKNAANQEVIFEKFLPIQNLESNNKNINENFLFLPSSYEIVKNIIPRSLKIQFYKTILDSIASEHGARMTAMHKATDNATEILKELKLSYNKARQAAITNEILEIVSGAEALKG